MSTSHPRCRKGSDTQLILLLLSGYSSRRLEGAVCCSVELAAAATAAVFRPRPKFHINAQGSLWEPQHTSSDWYFQL
jgi:hypothetical protein